MSLKCSFSDNVSSSLKYSEECQDKARKDNSGFVVMEPYGYSGC